jgi:uncharacterized protein YbaR (Trm112 family)
MQHSFLEILACPKCKGALELKAGAESGGEIVTGSLYCVKCNAAYPIADGIPNLLLPEKPVFKKQSS